MSDSTELKKLSSPIENKIIKIIDLFDTVIENFEVSPEGDCYFKFKKNLVIETEGSQIFYTQNGNTAIQAKTLHLNPKTPHMQQKMRKMEVDELSNDITDYAKIAMEEAMKKMIDKPKEECCGNCKKE